MAIREASIDLIAEHLRNSDGTSVKTCLLIGAGASVTAGVGLASDFVRRIESSYNHSYRQAQSRCLGSAPGYADCMDALPPAIQVELVRADIDKAKINWAHIGIARLEKYGLFDKILTPNFDPLVSRACALFNRFPAVYDLAGLHTDDFDASFIKGSAVFHLHGQHTGFLLLNTEEKLRAQARKIRPVLDAVVKGHPIIIAGYSGENDPLVDEIAALAPFNHGLFWVCHDGADPAPNVVDKLLSRNDCSIVRDKPADIFFTELANAIGADPPDILVNPFTHMLKIYETIKPHADLGDKMGPDLLEQARSRVEQAAAHAKTGGAIGDEIRKLMATGDYKTVWDKYGSQATDLDDESKDQIAWAAIGIANDLRDSAQSAPSTEAHYLFDSAMEKYAAALIIEPDKHEALNNWGNALADQAKSKPPAEADSLFDLASQKYAAALVIKPDKYETLSNWGLALTDQAKSKPPAEAGLLLALASEKYAAALAIKPDNYEALCSWGLALADQAKTKPFSEADALFTLAAEKFAAALAIKPNTPDALNNWGVTLTEQAKTKPPAEADRLLSIAAEKYAAALAIKPDTHDALNNWGNALTDQAKTKSPAEADPLFALAAEKYAAALAIKPDKHDALINWGIALADQSKTKSPAEASLLWDEAQFKYEQANGISEGSANYNLACLAALRGQPDEAGRLLKKSHQGSDFPGCDHVSSDSDFDAVRDSDIFKQALVDIGCT